MSETPAPANQGIIDKELEELDALTTYYWEDQHPDPDTGHGQDSAEAAPAVTEPSPQTAPAPIAVDVVDEFVSDTPLPSSAPPITTILPSCVPKLTS